MKSAMLSAQECLRARARPPRRPAAFFWACVPPCRDRLERVRDFLFVPELFPPRFEAPGELEMAAARDLDIPFFLRASYCFLFFTCPRAMSFSSRLRAPRGSARAHHPLMI